MTERLYEGLFLVDAAEASQGWTDIETSIRAIIDQHGGVIEHAEKWPEQRLAYEVNGAKRGVYYLTYFRTDAQSVAPIRADAELSEKVMRLLVIQEPFLEEEMTKRKELAERRNADPAPAAKSEAKKSDETAAPAVSSSEEGNDDAAATTDAGGDESAAAEAPAAETPDTEASAAETPDAGTPEAGTPEAETPEAETPEAEAGNADGESSDSDEANEQEQN